MSTSTIFLLLSVILLTGCVSMTKPIQYPQNNIANTISISSKKIENPLEATAGDYYISDSQISVGGASNITSNPNASMFGLIGFGITISIDKTKNYNVISKSSLNAPIKFDQLLQQKIKTELNKEPDSDILTLLNSNQEAHIKLTPSARIDVTDQENIRTSYTVSSSFKNAAENNKNTKRTYYYLSSKKAPLAKWTSNNNAMFHETANQAYSAITKALLLDIQNKIPFASVAPNPNMACKSKLTTNMSTLYNLNLIESPTDLCIAVARNHKNEILHNMLFIIEP